MLRLLEVLAPLVAPTIAGLGMGHLVLFWGLWVWYRRDLLTLASVLDDVTRGLKHRSVLDRGAHWSDQIEAFLSDIRDVLNSPGRADEREQLRQRLHLFDEKRRYLQSMRFETIFNVSRNMIEAYPLGGIFGTIIAIGLAISQENATVQLVLRYFGEAIWSTCAGIGWAIILMFVNSFLEPSFERLVDNRHQIAETMAQAKRVLTLEPATA
jgi:biopolymer transport protein ExbB/TolQ